MICLKLATRTGSFQVEVDATPADCGVANINYERKPLAVPGTWNTGTNYADSRYQLPQIDKKESNRGDEAKNDHGRHGYVLSLKTWKMTKYRCISGAFLPMLRVAKGAL